MKIYTKTGDKGQTGLLGGARISKHSLRVKAMGDIDELNATVGVARSLATSPLLSAVEQMQNWLFDLGAEIASPADARIQKRALGAEEIQYLEKSMDEQTRDLPELKNFILPGGSAFAAQLHLCRSV